jgi:hypothetical protein
MKISKLNQYNQGIGKYKLLSSTSGVGSIVTTKLGSYVLISDINQWKFLVWANTKVGNIRSAQSDPRIIYKMSKDEISGRGLVFVDDLRFVHFLKDEKELEELICLVGIPNMALDERFNTPKWTKKINNTTVPSHPIAAALHAAGESFENASGNYMIKGTHFPKWFKNKEGELKPLSQWFSLWQDECKKQNGIVTKDEFAPPKDAKDFIGEYERKNQDGATTKVREYRNLEQTNLVLICPNGHLSDIPWSNYLKWKFQKMNFKLSDDDKGENLFSNEIVGPCCSNPKLKWTESKTKSEGYSSIYLECLSCGLGSESTGTQKINLEAINSIQPCCIGQKPWEFDSANGDVIPYDRVCYVRNDISLGREKMRLALVTANNIYYANGFSSLFIPIHLAQNRSQELIESLEILERKYQKYFERTSISKIDFFDTKFDLDDFIIENDIDISNKGEFNTNLKSIFLSTDNPNEVIDRHEQYRWQEYRCFIENSSILDVPQNNGLKFNDINLKEELKPFFSKIQQVQEIKVTNVQLDFTRVTPKERIVVNGEVQETSAGKNIFSCNVNELFVLPANQTLGEGIFFQFADSAIDNWISENTAALDARFGKYLREIPEIGSQGAGAKIKIFNNRFKHFLIHSFSHLMMRELEFSCGYPTASLKERLYISTSDTRRMSGVLIYTAEGAEGSMGGLVSQGEPERIFDIINRGLHRAENCSSDPLCWESEGQGIFDLNLSACFSCSLVSETACEENNLGLDRRVLVDEEFGFFKSILY